jgi:hypothetical protein
MSKYIKTKMKYFEKHADFNSLTHISLGVGIGALLTYPVAGIHPIRFGLVFIILGILGYVWAATQKS